MLQEDDMKKTKPIIFSGPMVRAILDGIKTQTRRVIKPQPKYWQRGFLKGEDKPCALYWWEKNGTPARGMELREITEYCPHGQPGDILWVRETWYECFDGLDGCDFDGYVADGEKPCGPCRATAFEAMSIGYRSKRPSIFMPRWAARLFLRITDVRVERVQDITEEDARAEGVEKMHIDDLGQTWKTHRRGFESLWDTINAKRGYSWDTNPWVWVITFERIQEESGENNI